MVPRVRAPHRCAAHRRAIRPIPTRGSARSRTSIRSTRPRRVAPRPWLLVHGSADDVVPVDDARRLAEAAGRLRRAADRRERSAPPAPRPARDRRAARLARPPERLIRADASCSRGCGRRRARRRASRRACSSGAQPVARAQLGRVADEARARRPGARASGRRVMRSGRVRRATRRSAISRDRHAGAASRRCRPRPARRASTRRRYARTTSRTSLRSRTGSSDADARSRRVPSRSAVAMRCASAGTRKRSDWPGPGVRERAHADRLEPVRRATPAARGTTPRPCSRRTGVIGRSGASSRAAGRRRRPGRTPRRCRSTSTRRTPAARAASSTLRGAFDVDAQHAGRVAPRLADVRQRGEVVDDLGPVRCEARRATAGAVGDVERRRRPTGRSTRRRRRGSRRCAARYGPTKPLAAGDERLHAAAPRRHGARVRVDVLRRRSASHVNGAARGRARGAQARARRSGSSSDAARARRRARRRRRAARAARRRRRPRRARSPRVVTSGAPHASAFERGQAEALLERRVRDDRGPAEERGDASSSSR